MNKLKIRSKGILGTHHSWAVSMRNYLLEFKKSGHDLYLITTNNYDNFPKELLSEIDRDIDNADLEICYTLPYNFKSRFKSNSKVKMAIYNYETSILPEEWVKQSEYVDFLLPSSTFSRDIFVRNGIPESKCKVIPHGINVEDFKDKSIIKLGNNNTFRFLNISIPHYRKNINVVLEAYYTAFNHNDDVCLVLKTDLSDPPNRKRFSFEVDLEKQIKEIQFYYVKRLGKKLPKVEIIQTKFDSMIPLYNSCDVLVSASSSEGFGLPFLEALAANKLVISPRCTGQLDFLNDNNSLLYNVKEIKAPLHYQYWRGSPEATTFMPHKDDLAETMLYAFKNKDFLHKKFEKNIIKTVDDFSWEKASKKILELI